MSDSRFAKLQRGVNLSHWLWMPIKRVYDPQFVTTADMTLIKNMGLSHVRLPFEPEKLFDSNHQLEPVYLAEVDRAVTMALAAGLAVIIDPHPQHHFRRKLALNFDDFENSVVEMWERLARHYSAFDPDFVFLETMNEPAFLEFMDDIQAALRWQIVQERLIEALRTGAPHHTIIVKGDGWESIDNLLRLSPYPDSNLVYNFHFYDPHTFTHQGATWGWHTWPHLHDIPYPSSPQVVKPILSRQTSPLARAETSWYGRERWHRAKIEARITQAVRWARGTLPLTCNEFGAYRDTISAQHRFSYLRDVRLALEAHNIGWTMWDYRGGFSLVDGRELHPHTAEALGLNDFNLISPAAGETVTTKNPVFEWTPHPDALYYVLLIRSWDRRYIFRQRVHEACSCAPYLHLNPLPLQAHLEWRIEAVLPDKSRQTTTWHYFYSKI